MDEMNVEIVLLDIEGTVCPISFVKDVLFPYALSVLPSTLSTQWTSSVLQPYLNAFPPEHLTSPSTLVSHIQTLMSTDSKTAPLKALQGYLWRSGYENGSIRTPLFPDVYPSLQSWKAKGLDIVIYSSGSVPAQKLLFEYTTQGDLRGLLSGYFDTENAGMKMEKSSYERIAATRKEGAGKWLFLSDNVKEVDAAREAGMQAFVVVREGNAVLSVEDRERNRVVESFEEIKIRGKEV